MPDLDGADWDDAIVRLWDDLADYDAVNVPAACDRLLAGLVEMAGVCNAGWFGAVRADTGAGDVLRGWRIGAMEYLHATNQDRAAVTGMRTRWAAREVDELNFRTLVGAGERFRMVTLRGSMKPEWFQAAYYQTFYESRGIHDALFALFPMNSDAESVVVLHSEGVFPPQTISHVGRALRGLKWFHRRRMLAHGLLIASAPLSPAERRVVAQLLTDATEKEIARRLELAPSTVHQYVMTIYRKFGVKNRAGLMSLWLSRA